MMTISSLSAFLAVVLTVSIAVSPVDANVSHSRLMSSSVASSHVVGCLSAGRLCCQGKNNTCRTEGPRMSNSKSFTCFCDSACDILKDCCVDYKDTCLAVDCQVGEWDEWGACDVRCGPGVRQRTRRIATQPMNGGKRCPPLVEKTACDGTKCKHPRAPGGLEELREAGKILPAHFGPWRYNKIYNPYKDIRKNLFERYDPKAPGTERPTYCAEFTVTATRPACQSENSGDPWTRALTDGATVCVECQPVAMHSKLGGRCRGHGVLGKQTRWNAATAPGCSGLWTMRTKHRECSCNADSKNSFILV